MKAGDTTHRPTSVKYQLKANGVNEGPAVTVSSPYSYTFSGLAKYDGTGIITYSVVEQEVNTGDLLYYTPSYNKVGDTITVTNTYGIPSATVDISIEKSWANEEGNIAHRPESVKYQLKANGTDVGEPVTVSDTDDYEYTFEELPKYDGTGEIIYSVVELEVATGDLLYYTPGYNKVRRYNNSNKYIWNTNRYNRYRSSKVLGK